MCNEFKMFQVFNLVLNIAFITGVVIFNIKFFWCISWHFINVFFTIYVGTIVLSRTINRNILEYLIMNSVPSFLNRIKYVFSIIEQNYV